jgi:hypothetical protein
VFKTGTRPQKGDIGLWVGPSIMEFIQMADNNINWRGMPLLNLKFYFSDKTVFRLGLQIYNKSQGLKAKETIAPIDSTDVKLSKSKTYFMINPGIEYHFTPKNICDVYLGANIPIGANTNMEKNSYTFGKDKVYHNVSQNQFLLGIGAFVGLQFFIADLPIAIGLEGGLSGLGKFGGPTKHVYNELNEKNTYEKKIYYEYNDEDFGNWEAKKISSNKFEFGYDFRITFSYYFRSK